MQYGLAMHGAPFQEPGDTHLSYANPDAPKGGTLKQYSTGTFDTLNPYSIKGKAAQGLNLVYDRLMSRAWDEPFTMYPLIAEGYDMPEDRSSITFYLNPKARFHDGSPITAEDVLFSFETLKEQGRPNMRSVYRLVEKAQMIDGHTVKFAFGKGYDRETALIIAMMPVLSKTWWSGKVFDSTTLNIPLGNGPYRIARVDPGRRIILERVKDYWAADLMVNKGHHNFDRIIYDYYRDDLVAFEAFKSGEFDLRREYDISRWADGYDIPAVEQGKIVKHEIAHQRPERVRAMIFNTRRPPFDDIRVREALDLLFDFDWANKNLYHGRYKRIASFFPNSSLAAQGAPSSDELALMLPHKDALRPEAFDPAYLPPASASPEQLRANMRKADELLKAAGWVVENGKRMKNGQPLQFEILLGAPEEEKLALHFRRSLEKMGIAARIRVMDAAAYLGRLNVYDFDMTLYYWQSTLSPGTEQVLYWGCAAAKENSRWNYAGICNPAIDAIASGIAASKDRQSLETHVRALDRALLSERIMIPLYFASEDYIAARDWVKRPEKTPVYGAVLETWWMDSGEPAKQH